MKEIPETPVVIEEAGPAETEVSTDSQLSATSAPFFHVSLNKFAVMFVFTFGFYSVYWFYKQWQALKAHEQVNVWPIARAVFSIFFTHSLFNRVRKYTIESGKESHWQGRNLATVYIGLVVGSAIVGQVFDKLSQSLLLGIMAILLTLCSVYPLYQAQAVINIAIEDLDYQPNNRLTAANWLWVAIGSVYWFVVGLGIVATYQGATF